MCPAPLHPRVGRDEAMGNHRPSQMITTEQSEQNSAYGGLGSRGRAGAPGGRHPRPPKGGGRDVCARVTEPRREADRGDRAGWGVLSPLIARSWAWLTAHAAQVFQSAEREPAVRSSCTTSTSSCGTPRSSAVT